MNDDYFDKSMSHVKSSQLIRNKKYFKIQSKKSQKDYDMRSVYSIKNNNNSKIQIIGSDKSSTKSVKFSETEGKIDKQVYIYKDQNPFTKSQKSGQSPIKPVSILKNNSKDNIFQQKIVIVNVDKKQQGKYNKSNLCSLEKYQNKLNELIKQGKKFHDQLFPPCIRSLVNNTKNYEKLMQQIKWIRLSEIFEDAIIFNQQKKQTQPPYKLGQLGNPLIVSFLNILEQYKDVLYAIFQNQKFNQQGIYAVKICHQGFWKYVIVDDFIPFIKNGNQYENPYFILNSKKKKKIWPYLLHKALAKLYLTYQTANAGELSHFFQDVTGGMVHQYILKQIEMQKLKKILKNNNLCVFENNLRYGYKIEGVQINELQLQMQDIDLDDLGNQQKILCQQKKSKFKQQNHNSQNGLLVFNWQTNKQQWKPISQQGFVITCIIKKYNFWNILPIKHTPQYYSIKMLQVQKPCNAFIFLSHKDSRYFRFNNYNYSWTRLMLIYSEPDSSMEYMKGEYKAQRNIFLQTKLHPGKYYILTMVDWDKRMYDVILTLGTTQQVQIQRLCDKKLQHHVLYQTAADIAQRFGTVYQLAPFFCAYRCSHFQTGFLLECFINESDKKGFNAKKSYQKYKDLSHIMVLNQQIIENGYNLKVLIKPRKTYTVIFRIRNGLQKEFLQM